MGLARRSPTLRSLPELDLEPEFWPCHDGFKRTIGPNLGKQAWSSLGKTIQFRRGNSNYAWIHIGDDYEKDYEGAKDFGFDSLLLDRDGDHTGKENLVSSLEEAGQIINIMAQQSLRA